MGQGIAEDQSDERQSAQNGRAKVAEAGTDAHDADVQGNNILYIIYCIEAFISTVVELRGGGGYLYLLFSKTFI